MYVQTVVRDDNLRVTIDTTWDETKAIVHAHFHSPDVYIALTTAEAADILAKLTDAVHRAKSLEQAMQS
jgi:hypothetical protein